MSGYELSLCAGVGVGVGVGALCHVGVHFAVVRRARQVLALDEPLDPLLDDDGRGQEARAQLLRHLGHQQRVLGTFIMINYWL